MFFASTGLFSVVESAALLSEIKILASCFFGRMGLHLAGMPSSPGDLPVCDCSRTHVSSTICWTSLLCRYCF